MNSSIKYIVGVLSIIVIVLSLLTCNEQVSVQDSGYNENNALKHLNKFAVKPRNSDSEQHSEVVDYLVKSFKAIGLETEVIEDIGVPYRKRLSKNVSNNDYRNVKNIVAKISGSVGSNSIALVAHYDTVPRSPGANDNGAAVAAMLEAARTLKEKDLKNDVYFILTDREEEGLIGADALSDDEFFINVDYVLNFDARGAAGPSYMFEVTSNNYYELLQFAKANPQVNANSGFDLLIRMSSGTTDFRVFKDMGKRGFNFAYLGKSHIYHNPSDNISNINLEGMKQHFLYMYNTVIYSDSINLKNHNMVSQSTSVYFNYLSKFIVIKSNYIHIFLFIILILFILLTVKFIKYQKKIGSIIYGFFCLFSASLTVTVLAIFSSMIIKVLNTMTSLIFDKILHMKLQTCIPNLILITLVAMIIAYIVNKTVLYRVDSSVYKYINIMFLVILSTITTLFGIELSYLFVFITLLVILKELLPRSYYLFYLGVIALIPLYISFFSIAVNAINANSIYLIVPLSLLFFGSVLDKGDPIIYDKLKNQLLKII